MTLVILAKSLISPPARKQPTGVVTMLMKAGTNIYFQEDRTIDSQPPGWEYVNLELNEIMENQSFCE
ncbi:MAG: hypothetical protein JKY70_04140 [Mucilaginibacter sp.]|nr:hypothetical protein [Mucilaginibacter sp.]